MSTRRELPATMPMRRPWVTFAFFCGSAALEAGGFLNATRIFQSLPALQGADVGINVALGFGVAGPLDTEAEFTITMTRPDGERATLTMTIRFGASGFVNGVAQLGRLPLHQVGDYLAEFRFAGDAQPCHVTAFRVLPVPPAGTTAVH